MTDASIDRDLDRLIDGELTEQQYRRLLRELDRAPDGWKRCGLAFLEAQALRADLGGLGREPAATTSPPPTTLAWRIPSGAWALAAAACFLMVATWNWGQGDAPKGHVSEIASSQPAESDVPPQPIPASFEPEGTLQLLVDSADGPQAVQVPYYSPEAGFQLWSDEGSDLPPELEQALAQIGGEVQVHRTWKPVTLEDGAQVLFPIDQFQVIPARSY